MRTILTVCTGNICRSPVAAFALEDLCPSLKVSSAGLHALVGHDVDADSAAAAESLGITRRRHSARQFDDSIGRMSDLILVMEQHHRRDIARRWPHLVGKTFLLTHFTGAEDVPDPYKAPEAVHLQAVRMISDGAAAWAEQIRALNR